MTAGAPVKANDALARRIASLIRKGTRMADAAEKCGVDRSSLFNWMKASGPPYESFASIIRSAVSEGKRPKQSG